jgi:threonine dehydratase
VNETARAPIQPIPIQAIRDAQARIRGLVRRTPLVRLELPDLDFEIHLKLENLQPIGSFKLRGASNAMALAGPAALARGVYTASAGNMAQGVAWGARAAGVRCRVVVPDRAPEIKLAAIQRLGAEAIKVPFDEWWRTMEQHGRDGMDGLFIHPFADPAVIAGNGTIGLEILEDLPDVDAVLVPFGGGGLSCGIASALRALSPRTRVYATEIETAAPFSASLAAGKALTITPQPSFVDGIGGKSVFGEIWPMAKELLAGSLVVKVAEIAAAVRLLVERARIVAEGAGASTVAAALAHKVGATKIVCVISGGNIDAQRLVTILQGGVP